MGRAMRGQNSDGILIVPKGCCDFTRCNDSVMRPLHVYMTRYEGLWRVDIKTP